MSMALLSCSLRRDLLKLFPLRKTMPGHQHLLDHRPKVTHLLHVALLFISLLAPGAVSAATSCTPGQASVIGTEYLADHCPWEGSVFNYTAYDLECIDGTIQRNSMSWGSNDGYYAGLTASGMQSATIGMARYLQMKAFRDALGTSFVYVGVTLQAVASWTARVWLDILRRQWSISMSLTRSCTFPPLQSHPVA